MLITRAFAQRAARALQELGADVTLDVVPRLGHGVSRAAEDLLLARLEAD